MQCATGRNASLHPAHPSPVHWHVVDPDAPPVLASISAGLYMLREPSHGIDAAGRPIMNAQPVPGRRLRWAGYLLGFSLAGFFDGILLHQILQWHHLLIALEGAAFADMRVQVLADGLFHGVMYVLAVAGIVLLWRARNELGRPGARRVLLVTGLVGFGLWHVIDAVAVHWLLGFHRIRMDADNLLFWDLLWLGVFGIIPLVAAWILWWGSGPGLRRSTAATVAGMVMAAGIWAALPPTDVSGAVVLFKPDTPAAERLSAVAAIDARVVWSDASGDLWALDLPDPARSRALYGQGALLVSNSLVAVGCFSWSRPPGSGSEG